MRFWDSSAIVPLLIAEPAYRQMLELLEADQDMLVWWGTPVECTSAIARREREGKLTASDATEALQRLQALANAWQEVVPSLPVRSIAQRLLRTHPLRAADSLQLAAAIVVSGNSPAALAFVSLDDRLNVAAQREGFATTDREPVRE